MTEKNQAMLNMFSGDTAKRKLVDLPGDLLKGLKQDRPWTYREAVRVQKALLLQLLLVAPMRLRNLATLRMDRHLVAPSGPDGERLIVSRPRRSRTPSPAPTCCRLTRRICCGSTLSARGRDWSAGRRRFSSRVGKGRATKHPAASAPLWPPSPSRTTACG